jgi:hypothetical protein
MALLRNRKVHSMDIRGGSAEQEPIAAYRTRDHQAQSRMCSSEGRHGKANDLVQMVMKMISNDTMENVGPVVV